MTVGPSRADHEGPLARRPRHGACPVGRDGGPHHQVCIGVGERLRDRPRGSRAGGRDRHKQPAAAQITTTVDVTRCDSGLRQTAVFRRRAPACRSRALSAPRPNTAASTLSRRRGCVPVALVRRAAARRAWALTPGIRRCATRTANSRSKRSDVLAERARDDRRGADVRNARLGIRPDRQAGGDQTQGGGDLVDLVAHVGLKACALRSALPGAGAAGRRAR